jgi:signal transduction histidine kinase
MFDKLFPFHFVIDRSFRIVQKGSSLSKIVTNTNVFEDILILKSPKFRINCFDALLARLYQLFVIEIKGANLLLQGQFIFNKVQDKLLFCGNPWLKSDTNLKGLNLKSSDFAIHSHTIENADLLQLMLDELSKSIQLDEDLEKQRIFFEHLFDEIPVDMVILDNEKRFRYLNKTSLKDDELRNWMIGKTNIDYFQYKNLDIQEGRRREAFIQSAIDSNKTVYFEDIHRKSTEKEVVMLRSIAPFILHDGKKYLFGYALDISEIKKKNRLAEQKNVKLEKLNKELNGVIYSITHDFRSPILAIKALVDLMKKKVQLNERIEFFLNHINNSIDRLDDQIIDIYYFAKNSNSELGSAPVNLRKLVSETFAMVEHSVPYPIKLIINIEEETILCTDVYRLRIIINNLISNAVKYSSNREGNAFVEFVAKVDASTCSFYISDNGEGIPLHLQDKVFEIYFRANNKTAGTGLGLFICSEAIRKLGGTIELESTPGHGSTFSVNIPNK